MEIFKGFEEKKVDYAKVFSTCTCIINDKRPVDVSIIVPVSGRTRFHEILTNTFLRAIAFNLENSIHAVSLTFVEHSEKSDHSDLLRSWCNHIHIPRTKDEPFNKCLAHNIGALYSNKANFYLFHDSDTLVPTDFFKKLFANLKEFDALQSFTKRRLNYCDEELTRKLIGKEAFVDNLMLPHNHYHVGVPGASGGSMFVRKEMFFKVGGFCPEFFSDYSVEDQSFFDSISALGEIGFCDDPAIELFHLNHSDGHRVTKDCDWDAFNSFLALNLENRLCFIGERSRHLKNFVK